MLLLASAVKLVAEIALLALVGKWLLGVLAGRKRDTNVMYRLLALIADPFVRGARFIAPRVVIDRHLPLVAFFVLGFVWLGATAWKIRICLDIGIAACR